ncbi:MAG: hypothetical protein NTU49_10935 [Gammaproteobacteria bacterium]|nr:hypothetical protein [Gammaproteobacteria bacterium]
MPPFSLAVQAVAGAGFSKIKHIQDSSLWISSGYNLPSDPNNKGRYGFAASNISANAINQISPAFINLGSENGDITFIFKIVGQNTGTVYYTCTSQSVPLSTITYGKTYTLLLNGTGSNQCTLK